MSIIEKINKYSSIFKQLNISSPSEVLIQWRKFKKIEDDYKAHLKGLLYNTRIAVISSESSQHLIIFLKMYLYSLNISAEIYEAPYNSLHSEVLDENSELYKFNPDSLILLNSIKDIKSYPPLFSDQTKIDLWIKAHLTEYTTIWNTVQKRIKGCQIYQTTLPIDPYRQLGCLEVNYPFSQTSCIQLLNLELSRNRPNYVLLIDLNYQISRIGNESWIDEPNYYANKISSSFAGISQFANNLSRIIASSCGRIKKCLVLDLDNTLWGGIIGDDGIASINLDPNHPIGEAFLDFQSYILRLKERGILLAVCSKNNEKTAKEVFIKHPNMRIKLNDISIFMANWDNKPINLVEISKNLNIGLDSLVFFDDNPREREVVRQLTPEVEVIDVPSDPSQYIKALEYSHAFEWLQLSKEDIGRSESYSNNSHREKLQSTSYSYVDYLKSLELQAEIGEVCKTTLPRISQLINKSNQFNLRTMRYSESDILSLSTQKNKFIIYISLKDKFSDMGIISCLILEKNEEDLFIDTWVMSCRSLKLEVENLALETIISIAQKNNCTRLIGEYIETPKNVIVQNLLPDFGFKNSKIENLFYLDIPLKESEIKKHNIKSKSNL
jgi:FkbH-like protein